MKKSLLALAAWGAFAGAAHAQSSVTLYGIIDEGLNYTSNSGGHTLWSLSSGVMQGSRWGLRGTEDLGGGLKAIFTLENGFDVNTGKFDRGGLEFGRQAFVGLSSSRFGTLTLGRQYDSVVDYVGPLEAGNQWGGYIAVHPGDLDNFNNTYRANNSIKYTSPNFAGLSFGGLYSLGGVAGDFSRNQVFSLGAGYTNGPLVLGAGYLNVRNPNASFFGNSTSGPIDTSVSNVDSPVYRSYGSAHTYQVIGAGGAYTFGPATVGVTYSNTKFFQLGSAYASSFSGSTATFNNAEINFKYQLTPALSGAKYHQGALGADYFLSKRTDVYLVGVYQRATGNTAGDGDKVVSATASINGLSPSKSNNQATVRVGIRHKF
ncbi:hypothetical protein DFQ30_009929 [Apophysomyces sp. BC1015]|nr:hypothetical protein DFQ30_009929 [Apophysomyces sp. BC1015]